MHTMMNIATAYKPLIDFNEGFFLQILNTLILFSFLSWKLFKPVTAALEKRKESIAKSYEDANKTLDQAEDLKKSYEEKIAQAREERNEIIAKAKDIATKQANDIVKQAEEEAKIIKENAQKQTEAYRQKAMNEVKDDIAAMAVLAAANILKKEIDTKTNRDMILEFIDGVGEVTWDK